MKLLRGCRHRSKSKRDVRSGIALIDRWGDGDEERSLEKWETRNVGTAYVVMFNRRLVIQEGSWDSRERPILR